MNTINIIGLMFFGIAGCATLILIKILFSLAWSNIKIYFGFHPDVEYVYTTEKNGVTYEVEIPFEELYQSGKVDKRGNFII